ncbi:AAA family ATPase [Hydrogenophaga intermedia]|uniref:AAA family ATPase n=1 Tax=Hydrogenophaga intermedia TaxID=65786 RepID=UPI00204375D7|nr:AAA family ATPase [Hydrogenophaga intermedia]MCM3566178.1 AAA family ATPase [Hydrogenophaga intermedia]
MTDPKKTDSEITGPIGPGVSMVDAVSPYLSPKAGEVLAPLAPQTRRRPPSFTSKPAEGRARLLQEGNFVGMPHFAGRYDDEILLPPGVAEQFKALKHSLALLENETADTPETAQHAKRVEKQERAQRERERQELVAREAERQAQQTREKMEAELRRMGFNPDQGKLRAQIEKLPLTQRLRVYREEDVQRVAASPQSVDSDAKKRNEPLGYLLKTRGPWRRIGSPASVEAILALQEDHPHFGDVIQFVANHVALQKMGFGAGNAETGQASANGKKARAGKGASKRNAGASPEVADHAKPPVPLPPLLLYGPPGVGKTHFCESLAKVLGVPVRRHPMDQAETSGALLGSDAVWGNSRYGLVFDLLGLGEYANPLVILDELDKAQTMGKTSGGFSSPTGVLHSLLEPVSAAQVRDISLDLELDASQIAWIATANYPWWVPVTLRSRFREFFIMPPDAAQAIQLARSVVKNALKVAGFQVEEPDRRVVVALAHLSAREIYQVTLAAAAMAVRRVSKVIEMRDLPSEIVLGSPDGKPAQSWVH